MRNTDKKPSTPAAEKAAYDHEDAWLKVSQPTAAKSEPIQKHPAPMKKVQASNGKWYYGTDLFRLLLCIFNKRIALYFFSYILMQGYVDLMRTFLTFRSISTDSTYKKEMEDTAAFLVTLLADAGFHDARAIYCYSNPIVYAHYVVDPSLPTCLIYGHYDVQPAAQEEGRSQDPFDMMLHEGKLIARGAVDNKGQIMIHIYTIIKLIQENTLRYNVKFMIEGDEETGSPRLERFLHDHKELLACDMVMVSDGEIIGDHTPTLGAGFRGGCNMTLTLQTAQVDLHSGLYGGIAPNSAYETTKLLARLYDDKHFLTIDSYYDSIPAVSDAIKENNAKLPINADEIKAMTGIKELLVAEGYDIVTANGLLPTIQVTGLQSGYTQEGYRNAIPQKTIVKLNFRFASGQDPEESIRFFDERVKKHLPSYVTYTCEISDPYPAIRINTEKQTIQKAAALLGAIYEKDACYRYCGAAIPVTGLFQDVLQADVIIADLANEDCNMHGVHENFRISCIEKGLQFSYDFFTNKDIL